MKDKKLAIALVLVFAMSSLCACGMSKGIKTEALNGDMLYFVGTSNKDPMGITTGGAYVFKEKAKGQGVELVHGGAAAVPGWGTVLAAEAIHAGGQIGASVVAPGCEVTTNVGQDLGDINGGNFSQDTAVNNSNKNNIKNTATNDNCISNTAYGGQGGGNSYKINFRPNIHNKFKCP